MPVDPKPNDPILADQFVASSYELGREFGANGRDRKEWDAVMARYRAEMAKAHRFVLSDEFTRYATMVSTNTRPEQLLYRLQMAVVPYETVWIEHDLKVKVLALREFHGVTDKEMPGVGARMGFLIQRLDNATMLVNLVTQDTATKAAGGLAMPMFMCFFLSAAPRESFGLKPVFGCHPMDMPTRVTTSPDLVDFEPEMRESLPFVNDAVRGAMWGYSAPGGPDLLLKGPFDLTRLATPKLLRQHGDLGFSRIYNLREQAIERLTPTITRERRARLLDRLTDAMQEEIREFTGSMRFLVTVLAMLSEVPVRADHTKPEGTIRLRMTHKRPLMEYHKLTLVVPKKEPLKFIQRKLSNIGWRNRAHDVIAHWRNYLHEKHCPRDEHDWIYDHENGYRLCARCEAYSRRIREHQRGDPTIGWVRKTYVVKPSQERSIQ